MPSYVLASPFPPVPLSTAAGFWQVTCQYKLGRSSIVLYSKLSGTSYTAVYNILGNPVGTVPVTRENSEDQEKLKDYPVGDDFCFRYIVFKYPFN